MLGDRLETLRKMRWKIGLLGPLVLTKGDRVEDHFATRHGAELLARLAVRPGAAANRDTLCEELWPGDEPLEKKRSRLRQTLASLKRQLWSEDLGEQVLFVTDRQTVKISQNLVDTDIAEFRALLSQSCRTHEERSEQLLDRAFSLYRGPFMDGLSSDWVLEQRFNLESEVVELCDRLAALKLRRGDPGAAWNALEIGCALDPYDEDRLLRLIETSRVLGKSAEGMRHVETHCSALGIQSAAELAEPIRRAIEESSVSRSVSEAQRATSLLRSSVPNQRFRSFPVPLTRFIGRSLDTERLLGALEQEGTRVVTLLGMGGVGKTRLSLHVAEALFRSGKDDLWFAFLGRISAAGSIYDEIAECLRVARDTDTDSLDALAEELLGHPAPLLILDNLEHLVPDATPYLVNLLSRVPQLRLLVTSRHRLGISGEQEFQVRQMPVPGVDVTTPESLLEIESVQLFWDRAKLVKSDFQITPRNARSMSELIRRLEGVPLAIEICAALAPIVSPAQMLSGLNKRFELLVSRRQDLEPRHRALFSTIEYSFQLLPPDLLKAIGLLSAFRSGWTERTARSLLGDLDASSTLQELQDRTLIQSQTIEVDGEECVRFRMLDSIREFAWLQLPVSQQEQLASEHARIFTLYLHDLIQEEAKNGQPAFSWIELEYQEIVIALQWLLAEGQIREAFDICNRLYRYWSYRSVIEEGYRWYEEVLSHPLSSLVDTEVHCMAAQNQCRLAARISDVDNLFRYSNRYLRLAQAIEDPKQQALALNFTGIYKENTADSSGACRDLQEALRFASTVDDASITSMILINLGNAYWTEDAQRSEDYIKRGIELARETSETGYMAIGLCNLADLYVSTDRIGLAFEPLREGRIWSERIGLLATQKLCNVIEARIAMAHNDPVAAVRHLVEAIAGSTRDHFLSCIRLGTKLLYDAEDFRSAATFRGAEVAFTAKYRLFPRFVKRQQISDLNDEIAANLGPVLFRTYYEIGMNFNVPAFTEFYRATLKALIESS